jgi:nicotinate-nucleotide adenylyltransferase
MTQDRPATTPTAARGSAEGRATGGRVPVVPGALGVFGGTFDPIHFAHLAVAQEAADVLGLERVLFVPAGRPPHKPDRRITDGEHRLAMVELAIGGNDRFAVDRLELDRAGPSYTVDTLEALRVRPGGTDDLTLILSSEAFLELPSWHEPERLLELARIAVAPREGYPSADPAFVRARFPGGLGRHVDRVVFLDGPRWRLSASDLRQRAAAGRSLRYLVPDAVVAYIDDHALYRTPRRTNQA